MKDGKFGLSLENSCMLKIGADMFELQQTIYAPFIRVVARPP